MSYYAVLDDAEETGGDVATNSGWVDFGNWVEEFDGGVVELRHLCLFGWTDDLEQLVSDLDEVIEAVPPADILDIVRGLRDISANGEPGTICTITDGCGVGENTVANFNPYHKGKGPGGGQFTSGPGGGDDPDEAKLDQVFGHPVTGVLRYMGKNGWSFKDARKAFDAMGIPVSDATIRAQLHAGKHGTRGEPAPITPEQEQQLRDAINKPSTVAPRPPEPPKPPKPDGPTEPPKPRKTKGAKTPVLHFDDPREVLKNNVRPAINQNYNIQYVDKDEIMKDERFHHMTAEGKSSWAVFKEGDDTEAQDRAVGSEMNHLAQTFPDIDHFVSGTKNPPIKLRLWNNDSVRYHVKHAGHEYDSTAVGVYWNRHGTYSYHQESGVGHYTKEMDLVAAASSVSTERTANPLVGRGTTGSDNVREVFRHEWGHHYWYNNTTHKEQREFETSFNKYLDDPSKPVFLKRSADVEEASRRVSRYATSNIRELYAEAFTVYAHPNYKKGTIPKDLEEWFEAHLPRRAK